MLANLLHGGLTIIICVALQCTVISVSLRALLAMHRRGSIQPTLPRSTAILTTAVLVMMFANLLQGGLWALLFMAHGEFSGFPEALYHSLVNLTTLGYGDVVMSEEARLLGALEAANGIVMLGLTTGFVFAILSGLMEKAWSDSQARLERARPGAAPTPRER